MSWKCPFCARNFQRRVELVNHANGLHVMTGCKPPYSCGQSNCVILCDSFSAWCRHLRWKHENQETKETFGQTEGFLKFASSSACSDIDETNAAGGAQADCFASFSESSSLNAARDAGIRFVSEIRANSSATVSLCEKAVNACDDVVESVVEHLRESFLAICERKISEEDVSRFEQECNKVCRPLEFLSTDRKQRNEFMSLPTFVQPVQYTFGIPRYETSHDSSGIPFQKPVFDSWQYVPLIKTLQVLVSHGKYLTLLQKPKKNCGIIEEFSHGSVFNSHPLFSDNHKISLALGLYYDDIETANPLGSKATIHKIGVFYFTVQNLPGVFNSCMSNIHLLALAHTSDLKKHGYKVILDKISEDILVLETEGFECEVDGTLQTCYASLATVNGDNLGRHALFGFFESFRATHFCETCMASLKEIQAKFSEEEFELREPQKHDEQVKEVLADASKGSLYGISGSCSLNKTLYWHVATNWIADLMHDFLEGVGPYEVKLVLVSLKQAGFFSLPELNSRIGSFFYGKTDKKNKPSSIPNLDAEDHSLKQNAFQFFCLFRLLPLIIGDLVPINNEFWLFYSELRRCADILFAQKWTAGTAAQFSYMWKLHMTKFKQLFQGFNLIPKHHFLVHYPKFALCTGPPYKNMVASHEMKGNFFKRSAHVVCSEILLH